MSNPRLFMTVLGATAFCLSLNAQPPCSIEAMRGVWVRATGVGTLMMAVPGTTQMAAAPLAELSLYSIDEQGRLSGWTNGMLGGEYFDAAVSGSAEVKADCTGTMRFKVTPMGATAPLPAEGIVRAIVLDGGNQIRGMAVSGILGRPVGMETHRRLARNAGSGSKCGLDTLRGTYAMGADLSTGLGLVQMPGQAQPVAVPVSGIGVMVFDSAGGATGAFSQSLAGQVRELELVDSKVQVFEDCTGYFTFQSRSKGSTGAPNGPAGIEKFVILDNGEEVWTLTISTPGAKPITPGSWKRVSKDTGPVVW